MVKMDVAGRRRGKPHMQDREVGHKGWEGPHIPNRLEKHKPTVCPVPPPRPARERRGLQPSGCRL